MKDRVLHWDEMIDLAASLRSEKGELREGVCPSLFTVWVRDGYGWISSCSSKVLDVGL